MGWASGQKIKPWALLKCQIFSSLLGVNHFSWSDQAARKLGRPSGRKPSGRKKTKRPKRPSGQVKRRETFAGTDTVLGHVKRGLRQAKLWLAWRGSLSTPAEGPTSLLRVVSRSRRDFGWLSKSRSPSSLVPRAERDPTVVRGDQRPSRAELHSRRRSHWCLPRTRTNGLRWRTARLRQRRQARHLPRAECWPERPLDQPIVSPGTRRE